MIICSRQLNLFTVIVSTSVVNILTFLILKIQNLDNLLIVSILRQSEVGVASFGRGHCIAKMLLQDLLALKIILVSNLTLTLCSQTQLSGCFITHILRKKKTLIKTG